LTCCCQSLSALQQPATAAAEACSSQAWTGEDLQAQQQAAAAAAMPLVAAAATQGQDLNSSSIKQAAEARALLAEQ
jgi:hypothetical protein